jgi:hypothetical protein
LRDWFMGLMSKVLGMGTGAFQMQACDHEGVPSCERGPQGDSWVAVEIRVLQRDLLLLMLWIFSRRGVAAKRTTTT